VAVVRSIKNAAACKKLRCLDMNTHQIVEALSQGHALAVRNGGIHRLSVKDRVREFFHSSRKRDRIDNLAFELAAILQGYERKKSPKEALQDAFIQRVSCFSKTVLKEKLRHIEKIERLAARVLAHSDERERFVAEVEYFSNRFLDVEKMSEIGVLAQEVTSEDDCNDLIERLRSSDGFLRKEVLAAKLCIDSNLFSKNVGFLKFAKDAHLEHHLDGYKESLKVDGDQIYIKFQGKMTLWQDVKKWLDRQPDFPKYDPPFEDFEPQVCYYGKEGVQKKDLFDWKTWEPCKREDPKKWGRKYVFEYCVCSADGGVQPQGSHSWLRLKTPEGDIYSVGLYRPGKGSSFDSLNFPFRVKKGRLMAHDMSDFWPTDKIKRHTLSWEITKDQFEAIKGSVEEDKKHEATLSFQTNGNNCTQYVNSKAAMTGIFLPTKRCFIVYLLPEFARSIIDRICRCRPIWITSLVLFSPVAALATLVANAILLALGTSRVDDSLKGRARVLPSHHSFWHFFDPRKIFFHPPRFVAHYVFPYIRRWRKKYGKDEYAIPKEYRVQEQEVG